MGAENVTLNSLKKTDFIQNKKLIKKLKTDDKQNFFLDILSFPENQRIIVSTPQNLLIFETIQFTLLEILDIRDLKILQPDNKSKKDDLIDENNCSFYGTRGGTWATIQHFIINFEDYSIETKEIIRKHMPNNWLLNFLVLSTGLIVLAFNKGTLLIFDEPESNENNNENIINDDNNKNDSNKNDNKNIITKPKKRNENANDKKMNNLINNMYNSYTNNNPNSNINDIKKSNNNNIQNDLIEDENQLNAGPISKEKQIFKFKKDLNININIQQESCGFFEISDTCFIGITSEGGLRFFDLISEKNEFIANNYMQGCWANPHSKNSIILIGNKLLCSYRGVTIIDVNKRLIVKQVKSDYINNGILNLKNNTILITGDIILNPKNSQKMKRMGLLSQYVISNIIDVKGKLRYSQSSDIADLDNLSREKELVQISKKEIQLDTTALVTNTMELDEKIVMFSSHEIYVLDK